MRWLLLIASLRQPAHGTSVKITGGLPPQTCETQRRRNAGDDMHPLRFGVSAKNGAGGRRRRWSRRKPRGHGPRGKGFGKCNTNRRLARNIFLARAHDSVGADYLISTLAPAA